MWPWTHNRASLSTMKRLRSDANAGLKGSPLLHPLHVLRAAEMVSVFGLAQPTLLPGVLAGLLTLRNRTILLASSIPVIGHKQHLAMQTLATARFGLHQVEADSVKSLA